MNASEICSKSLALHPAMRKDFVTVFLWYLCHAFLHFYCVKYILKIMSILELS